MIQLYLMTHLAQIFNFLNSCNLRYPQCFSMIKEQKRAKKVHSLSWRRLPLVVLCFFSSIYNLLVYTFALTWIIVGLVNVFVSLVGLIRWWILVKCMCIKQCCLCLSIYVWFRSRFDVVLWWLLIRRSIFWVFWMVLLRIGWIIFWFCGYSGGVRIVLNNMGLELGIDNIKLLFIRNSYVTHLHKRKS